MTETLSITVLPGEETNDAILRAKAAERMNISAADITGLIVKKKSIDARKGRVKIHLACQVWVGEKPALEETAAWTPKWKKADGSRTVAIVGSGPAGLFAALRLLEDGIKPIIVERGAPTPERKQDIADITRTQTVKPDSNYCFGEGGAGTFSDGKLYTRSNKRGDPSRILAIFHHHGAQKEILTDAHPHIGTDRLPAVINAIRETIVSLGGEFLFHTACTGFIEEDGKIRGIRVDDGKQEIRSDAVILAGGHSSRDLYRLIAQMRPEGALEAKDFAMGVRVEHPREIIDRIQYHGRDRGTELPAAEYRLTAQAGERGVYSFCMCPGGLIVPSATSDDEIVVNGMSPSGRNSRWSNSAVVVEIRTEDIPEDFRGKDQLGGLRFQEWLEKETKKHGDGQKAPAQRLEDFLAKRESKTLPESSYSPGLVPSRLDLWLPWHIGERLKEGFRQFGASMRGFICPEALLVASETRTSSPVRILRNPETLESEALPGLWPAGEGSGYAGGIVSSAMDGEKCAAAIAARLQASAAGSAR